jgi:hypothetical protein
VDVTSASWAPCATAARAPQNRVNSNKQRQQEADRDVGQLPGERVVEEAFELAIVGYQQAHRTQRRGCTELG